MQFLPDPQTLLAVGVSLGIFGLILRTFARSSRRAAAFRQQHRLHDRKLGAALHREPDEPNPSWFEKHISLIANLVTCSGVAIAILSAFLK